MDQPQPLQLRAWILGLALTALTFFAFFPVLHAGFSDFDDNDYVTANQHVLGGLTAANVRWALTATAPGYWQPLSWLSLMADSSISANAPAGYHRTNLIIHALSAGIVFLVLSRLTGTFWRAALVAALYAVHPLRVESVAWVAERKDVLSNLMAWLTIGGYVAYSRAPSARRYLLVLIPFVLGLLAKPMIVTLPCLLLLLDYWPLRRLQNQSPRKLILEKAPLLLLGLAAAGSALVAQVRCQALVGLGSYPLRYRLGTAILGYGLYLWKMIWFAGLAVFYPMPLNWPWTLVMQAVAAGAFLSAITLLIVFQRKNRPWLLVGWLWFVGVMLPVSGIFQAGVQLLADRFSYLPSVGLLIMVVWSIPAAGAKLSERWIRGAVAGAVVAALCAATWVQAGYWRNDRTLFNHALAVTDGNWMALDQIGLSDFRQGKLAAAAQNCRVALTFNPYDPIANFNLGATLARMGKEDQSIAYYKTALLVRPAFCEAHYNLGVAYQNRRDLKNAYEEYQKALDINPDFEPAHSSIGTLLVRIGQPKEAVDELTLAVSLDPTDRQARLRLTAATAMLRRQAGSPSAAADTQSR